MMAFDTNFSTMMTAAEAPRVALALRCGPKGRNHNG
jgi:hypothetical protein